MSSCEVQSLSRRLAPQLGAETAARFAAARLGGRGVELSRAERRVFDRLPWDELDRGEGEGPRRPLKVPPGPMTHRVFSIAADAAKTLADRAAAPVRGGRLAVLDMYEGPGGPGTPVRVRHAVLGLYSGRTGERLWSVPVGDYVPEDAPALCAHAFDVAVLMQRRMHRYALKDGGALMTYPNDREQYAPRANAPCGEYRATISHCGATNSTTITALPQGEGETHSWIVKRATQGIYVCDVAPRGDVLAVLADSLVCWFAPGSPSARHVCLKKRARDLGALFVGREGWAVLVDNRALELYRGAALQGTYAAAYIMAACAAADGSSLACVVRADGGAHVDVLDPSARLLSRIQGAPSILYCGAALVTVDEKEVSVWNQ